MNGLKTLVSLVGLFLVFSFVDVNATEKFTLSLDKNKDLVESYEESAPIKIKGGNDGIIFDLSDEKVAKLYKIENASSKKEVEKWFLNAVIIHDEGETYNKNSGLYYNKTNSLHYIEYFLKSYVERLRNNLINEVVDVAGANLAIKQQFVNLIYSLFKERKFCLRYEDIYNFKVTKKFDGRVAIIFEGMTKEEKELFENVKNSVYMNNLEGFRVLREIRAFLQFFMYIFFYEKEDLKPSLIDKEYSMCLDVPENLYFCSERVEDEIMPYIMENVESDGIEFNGEDKDLFKFYEAAYNRVLNLGLEEFVMLSVLWNRYKFCVDIYNPTNIEYIKISDDCLKAIFKFKNNEDVKKQLEYLLRFEAKSFEDSRAIISKHIISSYIKRMKEKRLELEKEKEKEVKDELEEKCKEVSNEVKEIENEEESVNIKENDEEVAKEEKFEDENEKNENYLLKKRYKKKKRQKKNKKSDLYKNLENRGEL